MTIRIPETAYELLLDEQEWDGIPPAIRVRKLVLDSIDYRTYAKYEKAKQNEGQKAKRKG